MIYYFVLGLLSVFSIYHQFDPKKSDIKVLSTVSFVLILVLGSLRYRVGADWNSYENLFNSVNNISDLLHAREEKLFMFLLYFCKRIVNNYSFFIFILFSISFYLKYLTISKYSPDVFLSLIVYFYTLLLIYDMNGIRQGMAMSIILISLSAILNRHLFAFIILIALASLFHLSAIVFIPFYWLARLKLSTRTILIVTAVCISCSIPIRILIERSDLINNLLTLKSFTHYTAYINSEITGRNVSVISMAVIQRVFIFSIFLIYYDKLKVSEDLKRLLLNGYFIAILIFILLSFSTELSARLSFYYKALEMFILPIIVASQLKRTNKLIIVAVIIVFCFIGTQRILSIPDGKLIPYNSIIFK